MDLSGRILRHLTHEHYRPVKPRVLARQMGIDPGDMPAVRRAIRELIHVGKAHFGPKHLLRASPSESSGHPHTATTDITPQSDERVGRFSRAAGGFGFVRPTDRRKRGTRDEDIFVPATRCRDAADGDTVLVRITRQRLGPQPRMAGEIIEVVARRTHVFVGTYYEELGRGLVRIDGTAFSEGIAVGDPGAKGARPNDRVVLDMVRFPTPFRGGEAVITEVLGDRNRPGVDTQTIYHEFNLPGEFSAAVMEDAREAAARFRDEVPHDREDLTGLTTITIDPVDARDFDDAISLELLESGVWRLGVHIADVSSFVKPEGPLDAEARERATSIYLPDRVIPMLPETISNHLASLQPDRIRLTRSAFVDFSQDGGRQQVRVVRSAIRSSRRFTYEEVDDYLANPAGWKERLTPTVWQLLGQMHTLAMRLRRRRMASGALELNMPEIKLELDDHGQVRHARKEIQTESHQIIEEFMLVANLCVAERLRDARLRFLRRIHDEPNPKRIQTLEKFTRHLGFDRSPLSDRTQLKGLIADVQGKPLEPVVNLAVLKSLPKAVYSPEPIGHFALASDCYCHFTSPIRRYPDLTVHRLLDLVDRQERDDTRFEEWLLLGDHCSEREQRAEQAERELIRLKLLRYFEQRLGETFTAVVTGVESFGVFVQCQPIPGEGLIPRERLTDDYYEYEPAQLTLIGRRRGRKFRLGDQLEVQVARVDLSRRELDFEYVKHLQSPHVTPRPTRRGRTKVTRTKPGKKKKRR